MGEVAVIGVPDGRYVEALLGVIVLDDAAAGEPTSGVKRSGQVR